MKPATEDTRVMHLGDVMDSAVVDSLSKVWFSFMYAMARRAKYNVPLRLMSTTSVIPVGVWPG